MGREPSSSPSQPLLPERQLPRIWLLACPFQCRDVDARILRQDNRQIVRRGFAAQLRRQDDAVARLIAADVGSNPPASASVR